MKNLFLLNKIYFTMQANAFLYLLRKLPLLKVVLTEKIIKLRVVKIVFSLFGFIKDCIEQMLTVTVGIIAISYYASMYIGHVYNVNLKDNDFFVLILIINCIVPALCQSNIFKIKPEDNMFLNHFMIEPRKYYRYKIFKQTISDLLYPIPALLFVFNFNFSYIVVLVLCKFCCITVGHSLYLLIYDKNKKIPNVWKRLLLSFCISLCALLYTLNYSTIYVQEYMTTITIAVSALSVLCLVLYIRLYFYKNYLRLARKYANKDVIALHISVSSVTQEESIALGKTSWEKNVEFLKKNEKLQGMDYLNVAFQKRHSKVIHKFYIDHVVFLTIIAVIGGVLVAHSNLNITGSDMLSHSPVLLFVISFLSYGTQYSQLLFLHCDNYLISNKIGMDKQSVYRSYLVRLRNLIKGSILLGCFAAVDLALFLSISKINIKFTDLILLVLLIFILVLFADTYHLFIYYIAQPYTLEATINSPLYKITTWGEMLIGIVFLFCQVDLLTFTAIITAFVALFYAFSLQIIKRIGYKTFVIH